jgi:uncharacterized protein (TIGR02453 family)
MPEPKELLAIRQAIAGDTAGFLKIINGKRLKELYGEMDGEKLKTPPKGFAKDHPAIEYLKFKSFAVSHPLEKDKVLTDAGFPEYVISTFKELKPFIDFLRKALAV